MKLASADTHRVGDTPRPRGNSRGGSLPGAALFHARRELLAV